MSIISVKKLVKKYKNSQSNAVDNISFEVKRGEFFAFLGPNGAGKTTTISILTTTLSKTSGEINITGFDIDRDSSKVRRNLGIIFQKPSLDQNLTAEENIRFHAILYGLYPYRPLFSLMSIDYQNKVNQLAKLLGIEQDLFNRVKTFSGGMKRKLEIVRSLIHKPKILFLDEPTSGLDPQARTNLWQYLQQIRKQENVTIFLTTHYLDEAEDADRVCIINHGKIISIGTPSDLKKNLVSKYILIDANDRKELIAELESKKIKYQVNDYVKLPLEKKSAQQLIKAIETKLNHIEVHTPTLEQAYLEIISESAKSA